ncbi:unnamed protein product [Rotaria sordida]|uniref:Uncharacterized protein n=2 Tax=Rotaria sordida TaxID=392033 RepID=A0A815HCL7_9BILA|nr:unnamed protein product [Rotaria sordida]
MPKLNKRRFLGRTYARRQWHDQRVSPENKSVSEEEEITQDNDDDIEFIHFANKIKINDIGDLFGLIKDKIGLKIVTVLLYMTLRHFGISWIKYDDFLKKIGALTTKTANKWTNIFLSGSFDEFISEGRAKNYSVQRCTAKAADFDAFELAKFIDEQFYMITDIKKDPNNSLIRSVQSCLHDESTFQSGEMSTKRWLYYDQAPFYSKGRGKSNMLSDFLVMHSSGLFFQLIPVEYDKALEKYPELDEEQDIDYIERSASASMHVSSDAYFDNLTILTQFE